MTRLADVWPLFGLELRTPRLSLAPVRDEQLPELIDAVQDGIHDPVKMPFGLPWTDAPRDVLIRETVKHQWRQRCSVEPGSWTINFAVSFGGRVVGMQDVSARDFPLLRTVHSGSWLTQSVQGRGLGKEMRAAILLFAFDHLGAVAALSEAAEWNNSSLGVSRSLGYRANGVSEIVSRPGEVTRQEHLRLEAAALVRPEWTLRVDGIEPVLPLLAAG
ncbi:GNAT family N-acetyltransferase [Arthrobacter tumbae]|uniref:GNAT family N-acetyltransferase n=1 Tax=Arthrobacter tumbae TaxID=163874 RepID=UPI00195D51A1|nr:GNAT family N-acetyltransferase [Arthrobacter tumbae]MBM7780001.1 RimJ/RimL family protein N-acetyltransferase [Arthrobacter tumbae]